MEHSLIEVVNTILEEHITSTLQTIQTIQTKTIPICCFNQKQSTFYVFQDIWSPFSHEDFVIMLCTIHRKILIELCSWQTTNEEKIDQSEKNQVQYNKAVNKLVSVNFSQSGSANALNKIKVQLYNYLKKDLKNLIEYDFEF